MNISERIKSLRITAGLTQSEVANILKIPYKNYQYYELGGNPRAETLLKISQLYGVSIEWLITGLNELIKGESCAEKMYLKFQRAPENIQSAIKALLGS
jgi:transcriptional regulator with XRE-family HTH domain